MQTPLREVIARKGTRCFHVTGSTVVADAVKEMNQRDISSLLVIENDTLLGIFTERDVLVRVVDAGLDASRTRVADVMTPNPVTVDPGMTVEEAMRTVTRCHCRHLPLVVNGHIHGLVSIGVTIPVSKSISIAPSMSYSFPLSDDADRHIGGTSVFSNDSDFFIGGISLSLVF